MSWERSWWRSPCSVFSIPRIRDLVQYHRPPYGTGNLRNLVLALLAPPLPLTRVGFSRHLQFSQVFCMLGFSGPSCPRRRAPRRFVPYSAGFLDSHFRGNDDSALLSVKNLPLKAPLPSCLRARRASSPRRGCWRPWTRMRQRSVRLTVRARERKVVCCSTPRCPTVAAEFVHRTASLPFGARKWRLHADTGQSLCAAAPGSGSRIRTPDKFFALRCPKVAAAGRRPTRLHAPRVPRGPAEGASTPRRGAVFSPVQASSGGTPTGRCRKEGATHRGGTVRARPRLSHKNPT